MSGDVDESAFTIFIAVSAACLEGTAPWPILMARDSTSGFTLHLAADLRSGEPCYSLSFGTGAKTSPISMEIWQPHVLVVRKDASVLRWWLDGDELDAIPRSSFFLDPRDDLDDAPPTDAQGETPPSQPGGPGDARAAAGGEPAARRLVNFDSILIGRSVVPLEGAIPGRAHHHFFDGDVAELLVYRAALGADKCSEPTNNTSSQLLVLIADTERSCWSTDRSRALVHLRLDVQKMPVYVYMCTVRRSQSADAAGVRGRQASRGRDRARIFRSQVQAQVAARVAPRRQPRPR
jgi:hypothetical protein